MLKCINFQENTLDALFTDSLTFSFKKFTMIILFCGSSESITSLPNIRFNILIQF